MNKKLNNLFVTILTILIVTLIASFLTGLMDESFKDRNSPYTSVWIGMGLMVVVYYPMSAFLNKYFNTISKKYLRQTRKISKSNSVGIIIGFALALAILFIFYAKIWYNLDVLDDIIRSFK